MSFDEGNKYGLYITAIIAIVAIAGMTFIFSSQKASYVVSQGETPSFMITTNDGTEADFAGEAYKIQASAYKYSPGYKGVSWNCFNYFGFNQTNVTGPYFKNTTGCLKDTQWYSYTESQCDSWFGNNSDAVNVTLKWQCNIYEIKTR